MNLSITLGLAMLAAGLQGGADFDSDRPTFSGTPTAVPQGVLQVEAGALFGRQNDDVDIIQFPELLLRYGMGNGLELRLEGPGYTIIDSSGGDAEGWGDMSIGVKYELQGLPSNIKAAIIPSISITTDGRFSSDDSSFGLEIPFQYTGSNGNPFFGSVSFLDSDGDDVFGLNWGLRFQDMSGWSPFAEYSGTFQKSFAPGHVLHFGAQRRQGTGSIDFHFGFGLNKEAPDFFIGAGFTSRF